MEDWSQELLVHLCILPAKSKHRSAGKEDVVQTFDPAKQHGASERRFRSYINLCLTNKFNTMRTRRSLDPLAVRANRSLSVGNGDGSESPHLGATEEYVHGHSHLFNLAKRKCKAQEERLLLDEFEKFVLEEDAFAAQVLRAVRQAGSFADAKNCWCADCGRVATTVEIRAGLHRGHAVGIGEQTLERSRRSLRQLAREFTLFSRTAATVPAREPVSRTW